MLNTNECRLRVDFICNLNQQQQQDEISSIESLSLSPIYDVVLTWYFVNFEILVNYTNKLNYNENELVDTAPLPHSTELPSSVQLLINVKLAVSPVSPPFLLLVVISNAYFLQGIAVKKKNQQIHK